MVVDRWIIWKAVRIRREDGNRDLHGEVSMPCLDIFPPIKVRHFPRDLDVADVHGFIPGLIRTDQESPITPLGHCIP